MVEWTKPGGKVDVGRVGQRAVWNDPCFLNLVIKWVVMQEELLGGGL